LVLWIRSLKGVTTPAYTSSGGSSSGVSPLILSIPARPVMDMKARSPDTTKNSRLLPVLTAEKPSRRVMVM